MKFAKPLAVVLTTAFGINASAQDAGQSVAMVVQNTLPAYMGASVTSYFFTSNTPAQVFTSFKTASGDRLTVHGNDLNNNGIFEAGEATSVSSEKTCDVVIVPTGKTTAARANAFKATLGQF